MVSQLIVKWYGSKAVTQEDAGAHLLIRIVVEGKAALLPCTWQIWVEAGVLLDAFTATSQLGSPC